MLSRGVLIFTSETSVLASSNTCLLIQELFEIFSVAGPVKQVKIIPDVKFQRGGFNHGFVEYLDIRSAETALQTLNGRKIFDVEIHVEWVYRSGTSEEEIPNHFQDFISNHSTDRTPAPVDGCAARVDNNGNNNNALQTVRMEIHVVHDNPSAISTTNTARKFGPRLSLDQFCSTYGLSDGIKNKLEEHEITGPHALPFVSDSHLLDDVELEIGEMADVRYAQQQWSNAQSF